MKTIPFDLEKAKAGHKVCTRDGRPARIVCWDLKDADYPIVACVNTDNCEEAIMYTMDGHYNAGTSPYVSRNDLMLAVDERRSILFSCTFEL